MKMPLNLKILIGIICLGIVFQIYTLSLAMNFSSVGSNVSRLLGIIISIAIIKGFINRSNISRQLYIGLTIICLLAVATAFYWISAVPMPDNGKKPYFLLLFAASIEVYSIWVLFSKEVVNYFKKNNIIARPDPSQGLGPIRGPRL